LPFFALMARAAKRSKWVLGLVAFIALVAHYIDLYWLIIPEFRQMGNPFRAVDVTTGLACVGIFAVWVVYRLGCGTLVPLKDPQLISSVEFKNV